MTGVQTCALPISLSPMEYSVVCLQLDVPPKDHYDMMDHLRLSDPEIFDAIISEARRQGDGLELIASENFVSPSVLEAMGTVMTNKYAEGLPDKRYYGGCEFVDVVEKLARERVKIGRASCRERV